MRPMRLSVAIVLSLGTSGPVRAQLPAIPGAPALPGGPIPALPGAATGAATGATGAAGAAPPGNIWSFFMKTPAQKAQIKACICGSPIGQLLNSMMMPAALATGGILGPICPGPNTPSAADLAKPPTSAQGAAAKIKAEEAQAKAKIAAIEYLATVDCRYYHEAEAALIAGLRAEKNECVRLAAAKALASGCCCSTKVVKALLICVNCSTKDGFPAEASELVRTYAYVALERCLRKCVEAEPDSPPEPPPAAKKAMYETLVPMEGLTDYTVAVLLASYYAPDSTESQATVIAAARQTLARGIVLSPQTIARLSGPRNVRDMMFPIARRPVAFTLAPAPPNPATVADPQQVAATMNGAGDPNAPTPEKKTGRGNLLNLTQDAFKR